MSVFKLNNTGRGDKLPQLVAGLRADINNKGAVLANPERAKDLTIGFESLTTGNATLLENYLDQASSTITQQAQDVGFTPEQIKDFGPGLEAATIVLGAAGNLSEYARMAATSVASGANVVQASSVGFDYGSPSLEAFDEVPLKEMLDYSIGWNLMAARQDAFGEAFFRTIVVTPELGGVDVTVPLVTVFDKAEHEKSGKRSDFKRRNLVDAFVDKDILADESTRLVPVRYVDNSNASYFVPAGAVGAYSVTVAGVSVPTAPLAMGQSIDLLGASSYEPLIGLGALDINDAIDKGAKIAALYLQTATGKPAIKFSTGSIPRASWVKSPEGSYRDLVLSFDSFLRFDKDTVAVDGTAVSELAAIVGSNRTAVFDVKIKGDMNVETGNTSTMAFPITLRSLKDENGLDIATDSGDGATIKAAVEATKVIGYDIDANRTNSNRRTVGLRVNNNLFTNRYQIPVGSPISVQAPHSSNNDAADLKALIAVARVRNSNNAVTKLTQTAEFLEEHYIDGLSDDEIFGMFPGMGRYLLKPYFETHELDMEASINTIASHEKADDISAVLVQAIRDVGIRLYQRSRYQAALDVLTGGTGETPRLVVGTDQVISRYLIVPGDTRTFGQTFPNSSIVVSQDLRVRGKIFLAFVRDGQEGIDVLSFGNHLWIPELVTTVTNVSRNNQQIKETQVQPRTLHMINAPVMAVINVSNLHKVAVDKISTPALDTDITQPFLDGHNYQAP
jgi:hypothetical protein